MTSPPSSTSTGRDSPVSAAVFTDDFPEIITPSSAIRSPGRITISSPTVTSSGFTVTICPSRQTLALSGLIFIKSAIDFLLLSTAAS